MTWPSQNAMGRNSLDSGFSKNRWIAQTGPTVKQRFTAETRVDSRNQTQTFLTKYRAWLSMCRTQFEDSTLPWRVNMTGLNET